jgi:hydroxymethylbilane synthase
MVIRIGTRESELALWQANLVRSMLEQHGYQTELVPVKSEGDVDLVTPLYEMGVQGIFTRSLDLALLNNKIDIAVHSMKDVPTQLPFDISVAAILKRAKSSDLLVFREKILAEEELMGLHALIATSSIRRKAQWLNRYPHHRLENLRGNVNTRLSKLSESEWTAAIFATAGLERINKRPENSIELGWMLPAPAQGAIMVVGRTSDEKVLEACALLNDKPTAICTRVEKDFLRALMGGCSTPISARAIIRETRLVFEGSLLSTDGKLKAEVNATVNLNESEDLGLRMAEQIKLNGGAAILATFNK